MKSKRPKADATGAALDPDGLDIRTVPGPLKRPAGFFKRHRNNFFMLAATLVAGFVLNALAGDIWSRYVSPWKGSQDEYIQQVAAEQKKQFEALNAGVAEIKRGLPAEGRNAFEAFERSIANIERDSAGLVQQLDLAHRELAALRTIAPDRSGLGGGYDFTLAANASIDLAPGAVLGLSRVSANGVRVNLTSGG